MFNYQGCVGYTPYWFVFRKIAFHGLNYHQMALML